MAQGKNKERTVRLSLRMTPDEMAAIKRCALAANMTITAYVVAETIGDKLGQMILDGFENSPEKKSRKKKAN